MWLIFFGATERIRARFGGSGTVVIENARKPGYCFASSTRFSV